MKRKFGICIGVLLLILSVGALLYPTISDYVTKLSHRHTIDNYIFEAEKMGPDDSYLILKEANTYNKSLVGKEPSTILNVIDEEEYNNQLKITNIGVMGYIEIPKIDVYIPIYHGTSEAVLQKGIGHLQSSSLPIGGESVHTVLSGHSGLRSARMFTDLDKLKIGDIFQITVLNNTITYEVDQIVVVEPSEMDNLIIEEGKDYCTLVTCTPYGVNTHRLLVRGHRIENPIKDDSYQTLVSSKTSTDTIKVIVIVVLLVFVIAGLGIYCRCLINKKRLRKNVE